MRLNFNYIDSELIKKATILTSMITLIPDYKVFSLYSRDRTYKRNHKISNARRIEDYWKATGNYLTDAMKELGTDIQTSKRLPDARPRR